MSYSTIVIHLLAIISCGAREREPRAFFYVHIFLVIFSLSLFLSRSHSVSVSLLLMASFSKLFPIECTSNAIEFAMLFKHQQLILFAQGIIVYFVWFGVFFFFSVFVCNSMIVEIYKSMISIIHGQNGFLSKKIFFSSSLFPFFLKQTLFLITKRFLHSFVRWLVGWLTVCSYVRINVVCMLSSIAC